MELRSLSFHKQIAPAINKPIQLGELLKRVKALQAELSSFDQDTVNKKSLEKVAKDLVSSNLLHHRDAGVRSYVSCCLADMLRLFAPDAPYTESQLQEVFQLFIDQLKGLRNTESPYYAQQFYLLESLATVKSGILATDLPNAETVVTKFFRCFFQIAESNNMKTVLYYMTEILVQLMDETETLSTKAVEEILAQFCQTLPANQSNNKKRKIDDNHPKSLPPAYTMAVSICTSCPEQMTRYVTNFLSEVFYDSIKTQQEGTNEDLNPEGDEFKNLDKAHSLIIRLWKAAPEILQNIIPQLEGELMVENVHLRVLACKTVGQIISEIPERISFESAYPNTFKLWLARTSDKSHLVRMQWAQISITILNNRMELPGQEISKGICALILDTDKRVRLDMCRDLTQCNLEAIAFHLCDSEILTGVGGRVKDIESSVRSQACTTLGKVYKLVYEESVNPSSSSSSVNSNEVLERIQWIPSVILNAYYLNNPETNAIVELTLFDQLLGKETDVAKRTRRFLTVASHLDERASQSFYAIPARQEKYFTQLVVLYIDACKVYSGRKQSHIDHQKDQRSSTPPTAADQDPKLKLTKIIDKIAAYIPEPSKGRTNLWAFAKLGDHKLFNYVLQACDYKNTFKTVMKATNEVIERLSKIESNSTSSTIKLLLYRAGIIFFNKSFIGDLLNISKAGGVQGDEQEKRLGKAAQQVLEHISQSHPQIMLSHCRELISLVMQEEKQEVPTATLRAIVAVSKRYPKQVSEYTNFRKTLEQLATQSEWPQSARYATKILFITYEEGEDRIKFEDELVTRAVLDEKKDEKVYLSRLACLGEVALRAQSPWVRKYLQHDLSKQVVNEILLVNKNNKQSIGNTGEPEWVDDDHFGYEGQAKVLAVRILGNTVRGAANSIVANELTTVHTIARPVLKLLNTIISSGGEIVQQGEPATPKYTKSRLCLEAGVMMLKLSMYKESILGFVSHSQRYQLALVIQHSCFHVREAFAKSIMKYASRRSKEDQKVILPSSYVVFLFLGAHEPEKSLKQEILTWTRAKYQRASAVVLERDYMELNLILSRHPDFTLEDGIVDSKTEADDVLDMAPYLIMFLQCVISPENISMMYYLAQFIKQLNQGNSFKGDREKLDARDLHMYYLSEIAQIIIQQIAQINNWSLTTWPGKPSASSYTQQDDLLRIITPKELKLENLRRVYLENEQVVSKIKDMVKVSIGSSNNRQTLATNGDNNNTNNNNNNNSVPKPRRQRQETKNKKKPAVGRRKRVKGASYYIESEDEDQVSSSSNSSSGSSSGEGEPDTPYRNSSKASTTKRTRQSKRISQAA